MINYSIFIMGTKPGTKKADITETKASLGWLRFFS